MKTKPVLLTTISDYFRPSGSRMACEVPWREGLRARDLVPDGWDADDVEAVLDGQIGREQLDAELRPGDAITLLRAPGGPAVFILAAAAVSTVVNVNAWKKILGFLVPFPSLPSRNMNDDSSSVYGWSGPFTNYNAKGLPYPTVYGTHRVGGYAAAAFTEVIAGTIPQTYLYLLLVVSTGPIAAIGDIEQDADDLAGDDLPEGLLINGNPARNFKNVTAYVRLGSLSQAVIPGFTFVPTRYEVGQEITQTHDGEGPVVTDWSLAARFDMPLGQVADRARLTLYFPNGLFRIDSNGKARKATVSLQVRYQELNDVGNPIGDPVVTTGADSFDITAKQLSPFPYQIELPFYNPDTFQAPQEGTALRFVSGSLHHALLARSQLIASVPAFNQPAGTPYDALTVLGFAMARSIKTHNPLVSLGDWNENTASPQVEGLVVHLGDNGDGTATFRVWWGEGTAFASQGSFTYIADIEPNVPFFWAVTYKRAAVGGANRVRLYLDGALVHEEITGTDIVFSDYGNGVLVNTFPKKETAGSGLWHGQMDVDELRIYLVELTAARVAAINNAGAWLAGSPSEPDLAIGYRFDGDGATSVETQYFPTQGVPPALMLHANGSGLTVLQQVPGFLANTIANTPKRARWRVEIQRTDHVQEDLTHHDTVEWQAILAIVDEEIGYAGLALLGLKILATDQLSGQLPNCTVPVKGRADIPVWDGVDPEHPGFELKYSANPAWIQAHIALDKENGAGHLYGVSRIDWPSFKEWADDCEARVYDQRGKFGGEFTDTPLTLDYLPSGIGLDGAVLVVRLAKPVAVHLVVGKEVRLSDLTDPAPSGEYPEGDFTIRNVVSLDASEYELWLDWPEGLAAPSGELEDATAVLVGIEPRRECHLVLGDRGLPYLEARQLIASIGRAKMLTAGDRMRASVSKPRQPVAAFNASNIIQGTFSIASVANPDDFNSAAAEFQDRDQDYERNVVQRDHPSLEDATSTVNVRRKVLDLRGVTSASQVHRELAWMLRTAALRHLTVQFEASLDGIFLEPGDLFLLSHPLPNWSEGGRVYQDSDGSGSRFWADVPFVLGQRNMLAHSDDLTEDVWEATGSPAPVLNGTPVAGPPSLPTLRGWRLTFGSGLNTTYRQGVHHRGAGTRYTLICWARAVAGPTSAIQLGIVSTGQNIAQAALNLTTSFQRFVVSGVSTQGEDTDPTVFGRIRRDDEDPGDIDVEVAGLRFIVGEDDGEDAVGVEETGELLTYYAAVVNPTNGNAIAFSELKAHAGVFAAGDVVHLASSLGFVPLKDWLWFIGPAEYGAKVFETVLVAPSQDFRVRVRGLEWSDDVFPDEDDFETLDPPVPVGGTSAALMSPTKLPGAPVAVQAIEEAARDPDTGHLRKGVAVAWTPDPETAHLVDSIAIWLQDRTDGGPAELAAMVPGSRTEHRLDGGTLDAGHRYRAIVQPITRSGLRTPLDYAAMVDFEFLARFEPPPAPVATRVYSHGDQVSYEVDLPAASQDAVVEVFRGGTFVGQPVGRIPAGGSALGPTDDWCVLEPAADGRASPPLYFRLATAQGARGEALVHDEEIVPVGFGAPLLADSMEDGPWDTATAPATEPPVLTELVMEDPLAGGPKRLIFDPMSSALEGAYESTVYDLGRPLRAHVSFGVFGVQEHPLPVGSLREIGGLRERSWHPEGYTDPGNPRFGRVGVFLEWATSLTDDPGTDYRFFRCGTAYLRSCRFRIRLVRPDATWSAWVTRAGVAIRELPRANDFDGGEVS